MHLSYSKVNVKGFDYRYRCLVLSLLLRMCILRQVLKYLDSGSQKLYRVFHVCLLVPKVK